MKAKEKPIVANKAALNDRYQKAMKEAHAAVQCPYDDASEKRQEALKYIKDRKIRIKPLRVKT